jgi:hypothetical protein
MRSHRIATYVFFGIFLLTSVVGLFTEYYMPQSEHKMFWQNVAIGVWGSNLLVLVLEYINYLTAKSDLLHRYVNEAQKLQNKLLRVREMSGVKNIDLAKVITDLNEMLDFTYLFDIYMSFSFLNFTKKNSYKPRIDNIEKKLYGFYQNLAEFTQMYRLAPNESEQKRVMQKYMRFDEEELDILREELSALRDMIW